MTERVAVITGANTGIGYHTAAQLARRAYTVIMACRRRERADEARARLLAEVPGTRALVIRLDLSEPGSIQAFRPRRRAPRRPRSADQQRGDRRRPADPQQRRP